MGFFRKAEQPYLSLLVSFIVLMLLPGVLDEQFWASRLFDLSLFAVLIFGAVSARAERKIYVTLMGLASIAILSKGALWFFDDTVLNTLFLTATGFFLSIILVVLCRHVFFSKQVDTNIIYGAICIYFFFGILFTIIYVSLENITPGAFIIPLESFSSGLEQDFALKLRLLFYYSFVTQTTLGYGDITPALPLARNLSILQAIAGQMYIAILVARLIGFYLVQKK